VSRTPLEIGTAGSDHGRENVRQIEFLYRSRPPMYALDQIRSLANTRAARDGLLQAGAIHLLLAGEDAMVGGFGGLEVADIVVFDVDLYPGEFAGELVGEPARVVLGDR
jgi:hypothetical protein